MPVPTYRPRGTATRAEINRTYDRHHRDPEAKRFYHSRAWLSLRLSQLRRFPYCQDCYEQRDIVTPAAHVHHLKPITSHPELRLSLENLRSLCSGCHTRIEKTERVDAEA